MGIKIHRAYTLAAWLLGALFCAAEMVPELSGPPPFRRDRLPLRVSTMTDLSHDVEILSREMPQEEALRALALALALDPENKRAAHHLSRLPERPQEDDPPVETAPECAEEIQSLVSWLETPEATPDGHALAACLKDIMAAAAPGQLRVNEFRGNWSHWLPRTRPEKKPQIVVQPEKPEVVEKETATPEELHVRLTKASIDAVLPSEAPNSDPPRWVWSPITVRMSVKLITVDPPPPFSIVIGEHSEFDPPLVAPGWILKLLKDTHGELPAGVQIRIRSRELEKATRAGVVPTHHAAVAVLASAALSGREPDAVIIGEINEAGAFTLPPRAWDQIQTLERGSGRKLILPKAAAGLLPSFLVLEKTEFFMDYQVLLAGSYGELLDLCAKAPSEKQASVFAKFEEIRERATDRNLADYLTNRHVRERLQGLVEAAPHHASAAMLLLQTAADRPRQLTRPVLASQLRRALKPLDWIAESASIEPGSEKISKFHDTYVACRLAVDKLKRKTGDADLDLWEKTLEMALSLRSFERTARARGDYLTQQLEIEKGLREFTNHHKEVTEQLVGEARAVSP